MSDKVISRSIQFLSLFLVMDMVALFPATSNFAYSLHTGSFLIFWCMKVAALVLAIRWAVKDKTVLPLLIIVMGYVLSAVLSMIGFKLHATITGTENSWIQLWKFKNFIPF